MSSSPPTTLGKYQIIREIARSNDIVYEAYDPLMNRRVALKELAIPGGSTPQQKEDRIRRFQREVKAAGSLAHPNIVTIYEVGEDSGRNFMAMEFLDGHTLRNELDTRGFIDQDRALEIAIDVLAALDFAHSHGVVHRDIKPENIQILESGRIKLTDFGIARLTFEPNLTMDGQVFGTPSYMSPEQVVGREIDARSDVFSVGVVLYEMIAGRKPFAGDSVVAITYAIMNLEPEPPAQCSYPVWEAIRRAIDKSPGLRFMTAKEMGEVLSSVRTQLQTSVVLPSSMPPQQPGTAYQLPYGGTPVAPPQLPAANYPYNPYSAQPQPYVGAPYPQAPYGAQTGQPYVPQHTGQPYNPVPVYYPPPPRQPLLKPETQKFLTRLLLTVLIVGTFFILLIVGINAIGTALERYRLQGDDARIRRQLAQQDPNRNIDRRIADAEQQVAQLRSDVSRAEELRNLATLYEQQGRERMQRRDLAGAEESFRRAIEADPENPAYYSDLGELFAQAARNSPDSAQALQLWTQATANWDRASALERSKTKQAFYNLGKAESMYGEACVIAATDQVQARKLLYKARELAPQGSEVEQAIDAMLAQLTESP